MNDSNGAFAEPVTVALPSGEVEVTSARQAAEMLLYHWPVGETAKRIQARMACMRVLGGTTAPDVARSAFLGAALEADIVAADSTTP
ncbi:DUF982 domain-containing protein [Mesorhizobium retamae]|uniref:DUF982 domain-containing protein n=1 Tax=Mesorhizobium retamae TaxID=2912854 RepID=A0ABS9QJB0_9HYPH|nr:DUF982 domain-containing protein [Mesorhizobium sp. IRAMC:0171]MCG7506923.1 DUF982 domain-containing protein [Mesorhizobium sp. IRAMC:0171]